MKHVMVCDGNGTGEEADEINDSEDERGLRMLLMSVAMSCFYALAKGFNGFCAHPQFISSYLEIEM